MSHFFKTELGQSALQQRNIALTARQRRLLLLIDHDDFKDLDKDYKERIAPSELVKQLIDMGLLAEQETRSNKVEAKENDSFIQEEIVKAENTEAIHKEQTKEISEVKTPASETIESAQLNQTLKLINYSVQHL